MDRGITLGMQCDEIRKIEETRPDVISIVPSVNVLVKHVNPKIKINYMCSKTPWHMGVFIQGLSEKEAISQLQRVKEHYASSGCTPGIDLISPSYWKRMQNWWKDLDRVIETPRYAVWQTESKQRILSAIRFPPESDTFEIRRFRDEALRGEWQGHRSSRLNQQYRVIYRTEREEVKVEVVSVNAHDYRRR